MCAEALVIVGLGYLFLELIFAAIRSDWPESYYVVDNSAASDYAHSANPLAYSLFRFLPLALVTAPSVVASSRVGIEDPILLGSVAGLTHTFYRTAAGVLDAASRSRGSRKGPLILMRFGVGLLAMLLTVLVAINSMRVQSFIPPVSTLIAEIWAAMLVAVAVVTVQRLSSRDSDVFEKAIFRSANRIDDDIFRYCYEQAIKYDITPELLYTIVVVENLQRPRWFRILENRLGFILPNRTTGIAQSISDRPLTDRESIEKMAREKLHGANVQGDRNDWPSTRLLESAFFRQNPSSTYAETCTRAYEVLTNTRPYGASYLQCRLPMLAHHAAMGEDSF